MIAESDRIADEQRKLRAEGDKISIETKLEPWKLALGGVTAGATLFAAAAAFTKLFL